MLNASDIKTEDELERLILSMGFSSEPIAPSRRRFFAVPELLCREITTANSSIESPVMVTTDGGDGVRASICVWFFEHEDWNGWEIWDCLPAVTDKVAFNSMILAASSRLEIRKRYEAQVRATGVAYSLVEELGQFVAERDLGWVASGHLSVLSPHYVGRELHPFGVFLTKDRLAASPSWKLQIPPDLVIDTFRPGPGAHPEAQAALISEYFDIGVKLQWVLDQGNRELLVYRSPTDRRRLALGDTLRGESELEGFQVEVSRLMNAEYPRIRGLPIIRVQPMGLIRRTYNRIRGSFRRRMPA